MNVIICEADPASAEALRQAVAAWVCGRQLEHAVSVTVFHSSEDLMERFEAGLRMDALLTGLQFQHEESGPRAARVIHRLDPNLPVVLISNSAEYVYEGYAVSALRLPCAARLSRKAEPKRKRVRRARRVARGGPEAG